MIRKITEKYREFANLLIVGDKKVNSIKNTLEDNFALQILMKMFDKSSFLSITSWSISPKEVLHICNDIMINNRKNVIEFGSGFSTICIAQLIKKENLEINFISVESSQDWIDKISKKLLELELSQYVKFVYAPITNVSPSLKMRNQNLWYDENFLNENLPNIKFDCVIVDGPPSKNSPFIRFSALPYLVNKLNKNYAIFLDDYRREIEKEILKEWKIIMSFETHNFDRYAYLTDKQNFETEPLTMHLF